jgi:alkylhydroperoxidase family enzyme
MPQRIAYIDYDTASPEAKAAYDTRKKADGGYVTNMKKTLLRSLPAFEALMQWYPLRAEVSKFLDAKAIAVFCHSLSAQNDCLVCSMFFVREFSSLGVDLKTYEFSPEEELLARYGRQLAKDPNGVGDDLFQALNERYGEEKVVLLTAFGALMTATNLINGALAVELDEGLKGYLGGNDIER